MEDTYFCTKPQTFPTKLTHHTNVMYKAIIFAIFVFILPQFSPQSSETTGKIINWELIQLILVGIAVSYGLFSKKNEDSEEKLDKTNSYLSNIFHIPSYSDGTTDNEFGPNENYAMEMWKSRYFKRDSLVVLEEKNTVSEKQRSITSEIDKKPLFLPVRSLKAINMESVESSSLYFEAKVEKNSFLHSPMQCQTKPDLSKTEMKHEISQAPVLPLPLLSRSSEPKPCNLIGNTSARPLKAANMGKSVRTTRKCESYSGELEKREFVEEKGNDLVSKRTCLEIFDYRDYEKVINYKNEGLDCNNESGEGRDVDIQAEEFIAKFREQIRLQRTESFRR